MPPRTMRKYAAFYEAAVPHFTSVDASRLCRPRIMRDYAAERQIDDGRSSIVG